MQILFMYSERMILIDWWESSERSVTGGTIVFLQDIIVLPDYQRKGIGTKLLKAVMEKYKDVYQMELLTDNTEKTKAFYRSVGFTASDDMGCVAFIRM